MNGGTQQNGKVCQLQLVPLPGERADLRHPHPDEHVPLGVLAGAGLEEALQELRVRLYGVGVECAAKSVEGVGGHGEFPIA